MEGDQGYGLHPLAAQDILNIWEYIAADSPIHASRLREELSDAMRSLVISPHSGYRRLS
ncbi:MAG: type II toxin-antitoxin system RelE/ParE family toxin [Acidobacteriota bacterium]|nr:type II toxin-antitoxin system RelE/ParE family toxin [Acidobacteriota bacterium]